MCGICGILNFGGAPASVPVLRAMTETLCHRGPEALGVHVDAFVPAVGLGHTRLRIIDLREVADQPMVSDDGRVLLTFNGEIYNYRELRSGLESRGVKFRTESDTEVLLRLYEVKGESAVADVHGMFAFALWDGRAGRLVLGRDRVGKKPLYYAVAPRFFAFGSEIKALLRHPDIDAEVDESVLPAFFLYGYAPSPSTLYRGIQQIPPGHTLTVTLDGRTSLREYWDVPLETSNGEGWTEEAAVAEVRRLLTEAVERRMIADVPLGAFLSGGLDSSIVVALMARLSPEPVRTFSIGFANAPAFDETRYAELVARACHTRHTTFIVEPSAVDLIERLVWHHDGPFADSSAVPTYVLARLARQHVTVALNGDGGDELFAGYLRFYASLMSERIPAWTRRAARQAAGWLPEAGTHRHPLRRLKRLAAGAALPLVDRLTRWVSVFGDDLAELLHGASAVAAQAAGTDPWLARTRDTSALNRILYLNMRTYLLGDLLVKMDRCSMAHALEARSPFLDTALIEFAFRLPDRLRLRGRRTKYILRRAFADVLPAEILTRGKMGFGVPLQQWFRSDLREYLADYLLAPSARLARFVDPVYVRRLCEEHVAGRRDHGHRLWTLLTFEIWLRDLPSWRAAPFTAR